MKTANGKYSYSKTVFNKTLSEWVQNAHRYNCKVNGWRFTPLKEGAFGFDNIVMSLMKAFVQIKKDPGNLKKRRKLARLIHKGWCENYIFWRDNKPFLNNNKYIAPAKKLGDKRRDECAKTQFKDLSDEEKEKDLIFADFIINSLKDHNI